MRYGCAFLFLLISCLASAQNKNQRRGYLRDSITNEPIALASVTNLNTKTTVVTGSNGFFIIDLAEEQVLSFAAVNYHFDTIHYSNLYLSEDTLKLFLVPLVHSLGNVTVTARGLSRYQLDSLERRKDFIGPVDYKIPTVAESNSGAGIALNLDRFSRHEKEKRKRFAFFDANEKEEYINYRFPSTLVAKYTGLKDAQLQQFMQQYRPSVEWLRKNTHEEDIVYYINDKLKLFFRR